MPLPIGDGRACRRTQSKYGRFRPRLLWLLSYALFVQRSDVHDAGLGL